MINGLSAPAANWALQAKVFAPHFKVITFDNRGAGETDLPPDPVYTIAQMTDDAAALLRHLKIPRAHVVGASRAGVSASDKGQAIERQGRGLLAWNGTRAGLAWIFPRAGGAVQRGSAGVSGRRAAEGDQDVRDPAGGLHAGRRRCALSEPEDLRGRPGLGHRAERASQHAIVKREASVHRVTSQRTCAWNLSLDLRSQNQTEGTDETQSEAPRLSPSSRVVKHAQDRGAGRDGEAQNAPFPGPEGVEWINRVRCRRIDNVRSEGHELVDTNRHVVLLVMNFAEDIPCQPNVRRIPDEIQPIEPSQHDERARVRTDNHTPSPRRA